MLEALIFGGAMALLAVVAYVSYMFGRKDGYTLGRDAGYREGYLRSARP